MLSLFQSESPMDVAMSFAAASDSQCTSGGATEVYLCAYKVNKTKHDVFREGEKEKYPKAQHLPPSYLLGRGRASMQVGITSIENILNANTIQKLHLADQ